MNQRSIRFALGIRCDLESLERPGGSWAMRSYGSLEERSSLALGSLHRSMCSKDQFPNFQRQYVICGISLSEAYRPEPLMPLISYVYASPSPMKSHHRSSEMQKAHHQTKPMLRPTQEKENPMQMSLSRRYSIFKGDHGQVLPSTLVDWLAVHDIGMSFVEFWYRRKATDGGYSALLTA